MKLSISLQLLGSVFWTSRVMWRIIVHVFILKPDHLVKWFSTYIRSFLLHSYLRDLQICGFEIRIRRVKPPAFPLSGVHGKYSFRQVYVHCNGKVVCSANSSSFLGLIRTAIRVAASRSDRLINNIPVYILARHAWQVTARLPAL